jgi:hypothetical protein
MNYSSPTDQQNICFTTDHSVSGSDSRNKVRFSWGRSTAASDYSWTDNYPVGSSPLTRCIGTLAQGVWYYKVYGESHPIGMDFTDTDGPYPFNVIYVPGVPPTISWNSPPSPSNYEVVVGGAQITVGATVTPTDGDSITINLAWYRKALCTDLRGTDCYAWGSYGGWYGSSVATQNGNDYTYNIVTTFGYRYQYYFQANDEDGSTSEGYYYFDAFDTAVPSPPSIPNAPTTSDPVFSEFPDPWTITATGITDPSGVDPSSARIYLATKNRDGSGDWDYNYADYAASFAGTTATLDLAYLDYQYQFRFRAYAKDYLGAGGYGPWTTEANAYLPNDPFRPEADPSVPASPPAPQGGVPYVTTNGDHVALEFDAGVETDWEIRLIKSGYPLQPGSVTLHLEELGVGHRPGVTMALVDGDGNDGLWRSTASPGFTYGASVQAEVWIQNDPANPVRNIWSVWYDVVDGDGPNINLGIPDPIVEGTSNVLTAYASDPESGIPGEVPVTGTKFFRILHKQKWDSPALYSPAPGTDVNGEIVSTIWDGSAFYLSYDYFDFNMHYKIYGCAQNNQGIENCASAEILDGSISDTTPPVFLDGGEAQPKPWNTTVVDNDGGVTWRVEVIDYETGIDYVVFNFGISGPGSCNSGTGIYADPNSITKYWADRIDDTTFEATIPSLLPAGCAISVDVTAYDSESPTANSAVSGPSSDTIKDVVGPSVTCVGGCNPIDLQETGGNWLEATITDGALGAGIYQDIDDKWVRIEYFDFNEWIVVTDNGNDVWFADEWETTGVDTFRVHFTDDLLFGYDYRFFFGGRDLGGNSFNTSAVNGLVHDNNAPDIVENVQLASGSVVNNRDYSSWTVRLSDDPGEGVDWVELKYALSNDSYSQSYSVGLMPLIIGDRWDGNWTAYNAIPSVDYNTGIKVWVEFIDRAGNPGFGLQVGPFIAIDAKEPDVGVYMIGYPTYPSQSQATLIGVTIKDDTGISSVQIMYLISDYPNNHDYFVYYSSWIDMTYTGIDYGDYKRYSYNLPASAVTDKQYHYIKYVVQVEDNSPDSPTAIYDFDDTEWHIQDIEKPEMIINSIQGYDYDTQTYSPYDSNSSISIDLVGDESAPQDLVTAELWYRLYYPYGNYGWTAWTLVPYDNSSNTVDIRYTWARQDFGNKIEWFVNVTDRGGNVLTFDDHGSNFLFDITIDLTPPDLSNIILVVPDSRNTGSLSVLIHENGTGFNSAVITLTYLSDGVKKDILYDVDGLDVPYSCSDVKCYQPTFSSVKDEWITVEMHFDVDSDNVTIFDYDHLGHPNLTRWQFDAILPRRPWYLNNSYNEIQLVVSFSDSAKDSDDEDAPNAGFINSNYTITRQMPVIFVEPDIRGLSNIERTIFRGTVFSDYGWGGIPLDDYWFKWSTDGSTWVNATTFEILNVNNSAYGWNHASAEASIDPLPAGTDVYYKWMYRVQGGQATEIDAGMVTILDRVPPIITGMSDLTGIEGQSTDFSLNITDYYSGISSVKLMYSVNDGNWIEQFVTSPNNTYHFSIPGFGHGDRVSWRVIASDNAGVNASTYNLAEVNGYYDIVDATGPSISIGVQESIVGETGRSFVGENVTFIPFQISYSNPVVFVTPEINASEFRSGTLNAQYPMVLNVSYNGFYLVQVEDGSAGNDGVHESWINWMVFEEGRYRMGDLMIEVGTLDVAGNYVPVSFDSAFGSSPAVLSSTQSDNNNGLLRTRINNLASTGFDIQLETNDTDPLLIFETVGYIAIEVGVDSGKGIQTGFSTTSDTFASVNFGLSYSINPILMAQLVSEANTDPAYAVVKGNSTTAFELGVEEVNGFDGTHPNETLSWMIIPSGIFTAGIFYNQSVTILADIVDTGADVISVTIEYQINGSGWITEVMTLSAQDLYTFDLPVAFSHLVEVRITAVDFYGNSVTSTNFTFWSV